MGKHGARVLDVVAEKYPQAYFAGMVSLARREIPGVAPPWRIEPHGILVLPKRWLELMLRSMAMIRNRSQAEVSRTIPPRAGQPVSDITAQNE
jgi:hypothetical protein